MSLDLIIRILSGVFTIASIIIGLMIKNSLVEMKLSAAEDKAELLAHQTKVKEELTTEQAKIKEELIRAQTSVRTELVEHNNLLSQSLAVHIATDEIRLKALESASHVQVNVQK